MSNMFCCSDSSLDQDKYIACLQTLQCSYKFNASLNITLHYVYALVLPRFALFDSHDQMLTSVYWKLMRQLFVFPVHSRRAPCRTAPETLQQLGLFASFISVFDRKQKQEMRRSHCECSGWTCCFDLISGHEEGRDRG